MRLYPVAQDPVHRPLPTRGLLRPEQVRLTPSSSPSYYVDRPCDHLTLRLSSAQGGLRPPSPTSRKRPRAGRTSHGCCLPSSSGSWSVASSSSAEMQDALTLRSHAERLPETERIAARRVVVGERHGLQNKKLWTRAVSRPCPDVTPAGKSCYVSFIIVTG